jgi:AraC-like DNA-binding protein
MRKFRESTVIPKTSTERIIPLEITDNRYFREISIKHCGLSILRAGARIERNKDRDYHILIISMRGTGRFVMESGETFLLSPGHLFFSNAQGQGHRHIPVTDEWELCWIQVKRDVDWLISPPMDFKVQACQEWKEIWGCMHSLLTEDMLRQKEFSEIENLQSQLLFHYLKRTLLDRIYQGKKQHYFKTFNELWSEVSLHISRKWDVEEICSFLNLSKSQATRLCREMFHTSLAGKVNDIKLRHAYSLLLNFNFTVSAVAEMIGYESISSFSVAFKNKFGFSPKSTASHLPKILD